MIPKAGDTYILYNIRMPDEYYALAEKELKETSEAYLDKHSVDSSVYSGDSDPIILRNGRSPSRSGNVSGYTIPCSSPPDTGIAVSSVLPGT